MLQEADISVMQKFPWKDLTGFENYWLTMPENSKSNMGLFCNVHNGSRKGDDKTGN